MKVFNLKCFHGHVFEGWFSSEADFQSQKENSFITCPICDNDKIEKMPAAPRLNLKSSNLENKISKSVDGDIRNLQKAWMEMSKYIAQNTENVGDEFPEQARKMYYGEIKERAIRGNASIEETKQLLDEGIEVGTLLLPNGFDKNHLQ